MASEPNKIAWADDFVQDAPVNSNLLDKARQLLLGGTKKEATAPAVMGVPSWLPWAVGGVVVVALLKKRKRMGK